MTENEKVREILKRKDESQQEGFKSLTGGIVMKFMNKLKMILTYGDNFMR
jgi:hypothetical protein